MKMIQNKNLIQKIFALVLIVVSFNFICPTVANAETTSLGGAVVEGIADLVVALGDGILNVIHRFVMGQDESLIHLTADIWTIIGNIITILLVVIAFAAAAAFTAGIASAIVVKFGIAIAGITVAGIVKAGVVGAVIGFVWGYGNLPKNYLDLPVYSISPQEVFYGKVPLLNVNFFNPDARKIIYDETYTKNTPLGTSKSLAQQFREQFGGNDYTTWNEYNADAVVDHYKHTYNGEEYCITQEIVADVANYEAKYIIGIYKITPDYYNSHLHSRINTYETDYENFDTVLKEQLANHEIYIDDQQLLQQKFTKEDNKWIYKTMSADESETYKLVIEDHGTANEKRTLYTYRKYTNIASDLQPTIAKWYVTLRNIALVMSMTILVYVGIRMMLTSIASEKAKYKTMLFDWVVGVALLFLMQYIMVFATALNDEFIDLISEAGNVPTGVWIPKNTELDWSNVNPEAYQEENGWIFWPTNMMGNVRVAFQNMRSESLAYVGYGIVFLVLVFYTAFFIFTYLKRVIYMAFLTIIAPFVAMTYPLDKINDGKAQAFNMWIKEYIFNLLIQPMHLLLYFILISSAMELANQNIIYTLVALGFLMPAEKLIRKFFGFDKAQTPGFLGGAAGAGLVMSAVGSLRRFSNSGKGGEKDTASKDVDGKIRTKNSRMDKMDPNELFGGSTEETSSGQQTIKMNGNTETTSNESADSTTVNKEVKEANPVVTSTGSKDRDISADSIVTKKSVTQIENTGKTSTPSDTSSSDTKDTPTNKGDSKPTKGQRIAGAIGAVTMSGVRGTGRLLGKTPNLVARGLGAATLGTVGLAAGIATGDASNALQYTLTGAGAGSALGSGLANRAGSSFENIADDAIRGYWGSDYESEYANKLSDKRFLSSKENKDFYKSMFGDDYKNKMQEAVKEYRSRGITDNKIIAKAMKLKGDYSLQDRVYVADLASKISGTSDWVRTREKFEKMGIPEDKINRIENAIIDIKKLPLQGKK